MAFHVACPITCRKICFCKLGFPRGVQNPNALSDFFTDAVRVQEFLADPFGEKRRQANDAGSATIQVPVPKLPTPVLEDGEGNESAAKRLALQRKAAAEVVFPKKRFEPREHLPAVHDVPNEAVREELVVQGNDGNVTCHMCSRSETDGSLRVRKMLSCKDCGKKYHRSCLKSWSRNRDLFHWTLWTCPSCRICEVCRRTGDPNKFTFCKRCDGAYHCYCLQPPHKTVSSGPYVCPKHTRCHSCGSTVPGNGQSLRWFLGYTCCDACGRLFMKGNYCPICLKVYRDSESTPMVCCDICQRWVHCQCDGISDERYLQFQVVQDLHYTCATCRGECYQVKDHEDAVRELWRRKDEADRDLIANLRSAAGLPTDEEIFFISPYSDDDETGPIALKSEYRSLRFSLKASADKSPIKTKEHGKKHSNKKHSKKKGKEYASVTNNIDLLQEESDHDEGKSTEFGLQNNSIKDMPSHIAEGGGIVSSHGGGILSKSEEFRTISQPESMKDLDVSLSSKVGVPSFAEIRSDKLQDLDVMEDIVQSSSKSKTMKGPKLVIHLGARNKNLTSSPKSDSSNFQRPQNSMTSNGTEDINQQSISDIHVMHKPDSATKPCDTKSVKVYSSRLKGLKHGGNEGTKKGEVLKESSTQNTKSVPHTSADGSGSNTYNVDVSTGQRMTKERMTTLTPGKEAATSRGNHVDKLAVSMESKDDNGGLAAVVQSQAKDSRPLLKLKFKNPCLDNQSSWILHGEEGKMIVKGVRSKRKRPAFLLEKTTLKDENLSKQSEDNSMDEIMEANWVLKKLGKDAVGKKVEVHHSVDNSWHKGSVVDIIEGTSTLSIKLDDGRLKTLQLGKQRIRFVPQKQKRTKA